jgi:hypothetical protein
LSQNILSGRKRLNLLPNTPSIEESLNDINNEDKLSILKKESVNAELELNTLLEKMPLNEKYSLLLQSYATNILESKAKDLQLFDKMEALYNEMVRKAIAPDVKGSTSFLDAAAAFCRVDKITTALRLMKAGDKCKMSFLLPHRMRNILFAIGGAIKVFGVANGQITPPVVSIDGMSNMVAVEVPSDEREVEVLFAGAAFTASVAWLSLQVGSTFYRIDPISTGL